MPKYYKLDNRNVTYKEYWNIVRSPLVIFLWLAKFFRIPLPMGGGMPFIESLVDFRVSEGEIAPVTLAGIKSKLAELERFGFRSPAFYQLESGPTLTTFATVMDPYGMSVAHIMSSYSAGKKKELVVLVSEFDDTTFFVTSDGRETFESSPNVIVQRKVKANLAQLCEAHQQALAEWRSRKTVRTFHTADEAEQSGSRYEKSCMEHGIALGRYVPMNEEENSRLVAKAQAVQVAKEGGVANAEILAELNQNQEKKKGWGSVVLILVVSMGLFIGVGAAQWSWKTTLILIPVLLFHELGHYLAMRVFKYRNLRMFFIPFFGAAVSGRHYNVPGWKKVVVSMMGPMPGIFVGGALGIAGVIMHQPWMVQGALMALIVNGFNLIPVLPLDGGWICHSLVFSRHYLLDSGFRVLAVIALVVGGAMLDIRVFLFLGIIMAIGIPVSFRVARIAFDLRKRELPHASEDDQTIPVETAQAIIAEVKTAFPKNVTTKMIAQHTLNIFETLNARSPGWLATLGLLFIYALNCLVALFVAGMLIFAQSRGGLDTLLGGSGSRPTHRFEPGSVVSWRGARSGEGVDKGQNIVVATFSRSSEAKKAFSSLTNAAPTETAMELFGSTALVTIPADNDALRKRYFNLLRAQTKTVFVVTTNSFVTFSLICVAPDKEVAHEIYKEANQYFQSLPGMNLIPPWSLDDSRSIAERQRHRVARQTYERLIAMGTTSSTNPAAMLLKKSISEARKEGDQSEVKKLQEQQVRLVAETRVHLLDELRQEPPDKVDLMVIELQKSLEVGDVDESEDLSKEYKQKVRALGLRMGSLSSEDQKAKRFSSRWGQVSQSGLIVRFDMISFENLFEGPPALTSWLSTKGCKAFKYGVFGGASDDFLD